MSWDQAFSESLSEAWACFHRAAEWQGKPWMAETMEHWREKMYASLIQAEMAAERMGDPAALIAGLKKKAEQLSSDEGAKPFV